MSTTAIITFSITVAGFIFGILTTVAKLSVEYGRIKKELEENEERDKEERSHTREKFADLYSKINTCTKARLRGLKTTFQILHRPARE